MNALLNWLGQDSVCLQEEWGTSIPATNTYITDDINPFTAMLALQSLWKRPIKVPNLKSLRPFPPFAWARERTSAKMHSVESRFVIGPSDILFADVYKCIFQPGNFTGWGSEGVNNNNSNNTNYYLCLVQSMQAVSRSSTLHCNTFYENRIMRITVPGILSPVYFTSYMPNTVLLLQLIIFVWTVYISIVCMWSNPKFKQMQTVEHLFII